LFLKGPGNQLREGATPMIFNLGRDMDELASTNYGAKERKRLEPPPLFVCARNRWELKPSYAVGCETYKAHRL